MTSDLRIDIGLATQLAQTAGFDLPLEAVRTTGTVHSMFRLGHELLLRLPRRVRLLTDVKRESDVLARMSEGLSIQTPRTVHIGEPGPGYPSAWSIVTWIGGDVPKAPANHLVGDIANLLQELQLLDAAGGPPPSSASYGRGAPLVDRDAVTREALTASKDLIDVAPLLDVWANAVSAQPHVEAPRWLHGDLASGNLIEHNGKLVGAIDFTSAGVGDPACDFAVAWELFDDAGRERFREAVGANDSAWLRARGWALSTAIIALPYYVGRNAFMVEQAHRKLAAVLV